MADALALRLRLLGDRSTAIEPRVILRDRVVLGALGALVAFQVLYIFLANAPDNVADETEYQQIGHHFGSWWSSGNARRTPGYPFLLALTYKVGLGNVAVKLWQALLVTAVAIAVSILIGLVFGLRPARLAAWAQALYLPFFSYSSILLSDIPAVAASTFAVLFVVLAIRGEQLNYWYIAGAAVLLVCATIIRPAYLLFLVALAVVLALRADSWRSRLATVAIFALAFAVIFGPWIGRNYARSGKPWVLGTTDHVQLTWGLHLPWDNTTGEFSHWTRSYNFFTGQRKDGFTPQDAVLADPWDQLRDNVTKHPGEFLWSRVVGQYQLWAWPTTGRTQFALDDPIPFPPIMVEHLLLLLFGALGFVMARRHVVGRVMVLLTLITVAQYLFYYAGPRYKLSVMPFFVGASSVTMLALIDRLSNYRARIVGARAARRVPETL